jgi:hypothetical protein
MAIGSVVVEKGKTMNTYHYKNNIVKNGEWNPDHSVALVKEKARSIEPTTKQVVYRDDLYNFCVQKGLVKPGFKLYRTKGGISSNIQAFMTILRKNGLVDEFIGRER